MSNSNDVACNLPVTHSSFSRDVSNPEAGVIIWPRHRFNFLYLPQISCDFHGTPFCQCLFRHRTGFKFPVAKTWLRRQHCGWPFGVITINTELTAKATLHFSLCFLFFAIDFVNCLFLQLNHSQLLNFYSRNLNKAKFSLVPDSSRI